MLLALYNKCDDDDDDDIVCRRLTTCVRRIVVKCQNAAAAAAAAADANALRQKILVDIDARISVVARRLRRRVAAPSRTTGPNDVTTTHGDERADAEDGQV